MLVKSTYVVARYSPTTIVDVLLYKASVKSEEERDDSVGGNQEGSQDVLADVVGRVVG